MKSMSSATSGPDSAMHHSKFPLLLKQILMVVIWLVLFHYLNFELDPPLQKQFASAMSRSINDALPDGVTHPDDVYRLLEKLQAIQDPAGPMASSAPLAGGILLRQMRVVTQKCSHDIASVGPMSCAPPYSELEEEQEFKPWSGPALSRETLMFPEYTWQSADSSGDSASQGVPASGFILRLATAQDTAAAIQRMKKNNWIDAKTRALFVTGCFYNNVAKIVACSRTAVIVGTTGLCVGTGTLPRTQCMAPLTPRAGMNQSKAFSISRSPALA